MHDYVIIWKLFPGVVSDVSNNDMSVCVTDPNMVVNPFSRLSWLIKYCVVVMSSYFWPNST